MERKYGVIFEAENTGGGLGVPIILVNKFNNLKIINILNRKISSIKNSIRN